MTTSQLAEMFPPGEILSDELDARGWTEEEFAKIIGRPAQFVSEVINAKKTITPESAAQFGAALGTSAIFWLNLQDSYLLWKQVQDDNVQRNLDDVERRANLRQIAPVIDLLNAGFISGSSIAEQEQDVFRLFEMMSDRDTHGISFAARRSDAGEPLSVVQKGWAACIRASAMELECSPYSAEEFKNLAMTLTGRLCDPSSFADFQELFAAVGVKLVYVKAFGRAKMDGCSMIVDGQPVIGLSGRGKRLDKVFFTLMHEVAHILLGHLSDDSEIIVDEIGVTQGEEIERSADKLAAELTIPQDLPPVPAQINSKWIQQQAERLHVHPIILVGRLQNDGLIPWKTVLTRNAPTVDSALESWNSPRPSWV